MHAFTCVSQLHICDVTFLGLILQHALIYTIVIIQVSQKNEVAYIDFFFE